MLACNPCISPWSTKTERMRDWSCRCLEWFPDSVFYRAHDIQGRRNYLVASKWTLFFQSTYSTYICRSNYRCPWAACIILFAGLYSTEHYVYADSWSLGTCISYMSTFFDHLLSVLGSFLLWQPTFAQPYLSASCATHASMFSLATQKIRYW